MASSSSTTACVFDNASASGYRPAKPLGANLRSSLPGLTRQSIHLRKNFLAKKMDARVKPAHDWLEKLTPTAKPGAER
jgi:hypothetical protein